LRPRCGPVVVPAEDRAQDRRQVPEQRTVGMDDPVEADVDRAVPSRCQRPLAGSGEISDDLDLEVRRGVEGDDLRGGLERVRELALEVLLRRSALARWVVSLDLDVDRL